MIEWIYNALIVLFVIAWVLAVKRPGALRFLAPLASRKKVTLAMAWTLFLALALTFVISFDYMEQSHDIDDAVEAAVESYLEGTNPYTDPVVPRFKEMGHFVLFGGLGDGEIEWAYGPYNYLPVDLLFYAASYEAMGGLGSPYWFVLTNLLLSSFALALLNRLLKVDWLLYAPAAGCIVLFLAFDNTSLTLLLMVAAVVAREQLRAHREVASLVLLGVASLTKVFAGIPFVCFLLRDIQCALKARDWRSLAQTGAAAAACGLLAFLVIYPFGTSDVLDSTVFIYSSGEEREDRPMGGTLLSELPLDSDYYSVISIASIVAALAVSLRFKNLNDRVLIVSMAVLLVSVKSTFAPFSVVALFIVLRARGITLGGKGEVAPPAPGEAVRPPS
ncbi:MAG: glycosyltransferase 87 family protein [Candidatus Thermoplasmatota archaeon]